MAYAALAARASDVRQCPLKQSPNENLLAEPAIESIVIVIANAAPAFRVPTPVAVKRLVVLDVSEAIANAITEARDGA